MAEMAVTKAPGKIITLGLGSCVGACFYDTFNQIGGMIHIMLPSSALATSRDNPAKFADTGIPLLLAEMQKLGTSTANLVVKMVGGAEMFKIDGLDDRLRIGLRNIEAVEEMCRQYRLPVVARSVGGNVGKSISLDLDDGGVQVRMVNGIVIL